MIDLTRGRLKRIGIDVGHKKPPDKGRKVVRLPGPNGKILLETIAR